MSVRTTLLALIISLFAAVWFIGATGDGMPAQVALEFDAHGTASRVVPKDTYIEGVVFFTLLTPIVLSVLCALWPRLLPSVTLIPNRYFWLAPAQVKESVRYLTRHGLLLAIVMVGMFSAMHWLVVMANVHTPPIAPDTKVYLLLAVFFACLGIWVYTLVRRFTLGRERRDRGCGT